MMSRKAFSLVELLVVIAVIGTVMAILFPALSAVRRVAHRTQCAANLRQLGLAWQMYLAGNEGRFYQGINANLWYGGVFSISEALEVEPRIRPLNPYLGLRRVVTDIADARVFACPADRGGMPNDYYFLEAHRYWGTSYFASIFLVGQNKFDPFSQHSVEFDRKFSDRIIHMSLSKVTVAPARLFLMGDYGWFNQWQHEVHKSYEIKELAEWHEKPDSHNMAFLDGHVQFVRITKGDYVGDDYTVVPFADMLSEARRVQALGDSDK